MATLAPISPVEAEESAVHLDAHVQRMLLSRHFLRAETQRRLLAYLYEHRGENVSEYALATDALGRSASFDPAMDASVRVQISRLRRKLKDYYLAEPSEPELLSIPTGTHQLMVAKADYLVPVRDTTPAEVTQTFPRGAVLSPVAVLGVVCALLIAGIAASLLTNHQLRKRLAGEQPEPNVFWRAFLEGDAPIKILLPTPTFFSFTGEPSFRFRSTAVNDSDEIAADPKFQALIKSFGQPSLEQSYTVTWDTLAAIDLARYLDSVGAGQRVSFAVTRDSGANLLEQANVIMLGTHRTMAPLRSYVESMNFSLSGGEEWVDNAHPLPGEPARYDTRVIAGTHAVRPSIIALLPGRVPGLKVLLLQSRHPGALANMLSSSVGSRSVEEFWQRNGRPKFFEMVVDTEMDGDTELHSWPVSIHRFEGSVPAKGR